MDPKDAIPGYDEALAAAGLANHEEQHAGDSHLRPGGRFDPNNPHRPKPKMLVIGEDEDPPEVSSRAAKQIVRRQAAVTQMVEDALVNRVENAHGPNVMHVDWEQYMKMREDSEFQSFAKYSFHLLNYTDGRPRPQPVRPFLKNEVGIYREKIVCLKSMPGDSKGDTPYVQVPVQLEAKPAFTVEDDPFPSPKLSVEPGGKS